MKTNGIELMGVLAVSFAVLLHPCGAAVSELAFADWHSVQWALGQVETGANSEERSSSDYVRGSRGEVSRYQILPTLWNQRTDSRHFSDPTRAWLIARGILAERIDWFHYKTGREPNAFDLYAMWNAPSQYQKVGFRSAKLNKRVAERAHRFANLVNSSITRKALRKHAKLNIATAAADNQTALVSR
jgi:hypothetical protein